MNTRKLIRWSGLAAMASGILFVAIQPIHPPELLSSVTTARWIIVHSLSVVMCLLGMLGVTGIYARQVEETGWLGLIGYLMFSLFYALQLPFVFVEAFISPLLATESPRFVLSLLGMAGGPAGEMNLGAFAAIYSFVGILYMLGGLLFGIAMIRARILPRWAAIVLAFGAPLAPVLSQLPYGLYRLAALPVGIGLAGLGWGLWSERRERASDLVAGKARPRLHQTVAE